ncbi:MAG: CoA-binding protein [Bacteroidota bacterium]
METINSLAADFLSQPAIAVVGISSKRQTVANGVYSKLKSGPRTVYAVGKNTMTFNNDPCFANLAALPSPVQGVFIAARPENTEQVIDDCIALHIPRIWIHHMGGTTGSTISPQSLQKCRDHHITVIPGACPMMFVEGADIFHRCTKWILNISRKLKT